MKHYQQDKKGDDKSYMELYKDSDATKDYWNEDWGGRDVAKMRESWLYNHTFARSIDVLEKYCALESGMRVLDLGCGWGRMTIGILKRHPSLVVSGIDVSEEGVKQAQEAIGKECSDATFDVRVGSAEDVPFPDNEFDAVISSRVLHYVEHPQKALQEIARVLKPNGRAAIMVPNRRNPAHLFGYHTQLMTTADLVRLAEGAGLSVDETGTLLFFPPKLASFSQDSIVVSIDRVLSSIPVVNWFGGLAAISLSKPV